jgi:hypothetical protein
VGYVRTAGMSTAARRSRRRAALVITAVLVALLVALLVAMAYVRGWVGSEDEGSDDATTATATQAPGPDPADVVVNIFNATDRAGLAGRASEGVGALDFTVDGVGNSSEAIEGAGRIVHGPAGLEGAELLAASLPQDVELVQDEREDETLDLILGNAWEDLPVPEGEGDAEGDG